MHPLVRQFHLMRLFRNLVKDPARTDLIFKAVEIFKNDPNNVGRQELESRVMSEPAFKADFERGYMPRVPSLERLSAYPAGTFGEAVYQHYRDNGLDPDFFPTYKSTSKIEYISGRLYQAHDLWHVLLDYSIEIEDELALQAFGIAQYGSAIAVLILSGGLLHLLKKDVRRALRTVGLIADGYQLGKTTPPLFALPLHEWMDVPLEEVRRRCGLPSPASARQA